VPRDDTREPDLVTPLLRPVPIEGAAIELVLVPKRELPAREPPIPIELPVLELLTDPIPLRVDEGAPGNDGMGDLDRLELTVPLASWRGAVGLRRLEADDTRPMLPTFLLFALEGRAGAAFFEREGPVLLSAEALGTVLETGMLEVAVLDTPRFQTLCIIDFADDKKPNRDEFPFAFSEMTHELL
jgi:hypothetical protein